ncbi:hypothetical protein JI58_10195, partial [Marinosulfonomonas sp. PRT-SC04]
LQGTQATLEQQEALMDEIVRSDAAKRLILSSDSFLGVPDWMFQDGSFYKNAGPNTTKLRNLFPDNPCEFFLSIRNPSSFIPEALDKPTSENFRKFLDVVNFETVLWSDVIRRIQEVNPGCPITVWCYEDTPIVWPTVLRQITNTDHTVPFSGDLDVIQDIMRPEGLVLLKQYLEDRPDYTERQHHRIKTIFLEKFVIEDTTEVEASIPNWTQDTVDDVTEIYERDVALIETMPGVTMISI